MKKSALVIALALPILLAVAAGCGEKATTTTREAAPAAAKSEMPASADANTWHGTVKETMNSGGYTYVLLNTGSTEIWVAGPETSVEVGQKVSVPHGMVMTNFTSKTLDRVFPEIHFVSGVYPEGTLPVKQSAAMSNMPQDANHADVGANENTKVADAAVEGVDKIADGFTVQEIIAKGAELDGQTVKVRGRVVKYTANIMGVNWIHIQDSTQGDLTVTTDAEAATGDVILVEGVLAANKDFGAGYRYDVIIEKATVHKD